MKSNSFTTGTVSDPSFEMVRISKAKETVDLCANTIRSFFRQGLPKYQRGKSIFFSKSELAAFIRKGAVQS